MRTLASKWYSIAAQAQDAGWACHSEHYGIWFILATSAMIEGNLEVDRCVRSGELDLIPTVLR